ncbi:hypothetical protein GCM10011578_096980 [Streptomyces fuscichromogenes]|uniref:Uncharacterized protein n=1 Tax=Streptomyces fuscichromogenes TaxID=1324013 RepID=A0A917XQ26_9ACTN|nr:hypothetical protein GCM10011578_096980 [Streptomyces fuscichromogenes]
MVAGEVLGEVGEDMPTECPHVLSVDDECLLSDRAEQGRLFGDGQAADRAEGSVHSQAFYPVALQLLAGPAEVVDPLRGVDDRSGL